MVKEKPQETSQNCMEDLSFAVVGLANNCEKSLRAEIYRIKKALANAKSITWLIVESDSSDQTVIELKELQSEISNFTFATLGKLSTDFPRRTERISHCRNYYAEQIRSHKAFSAIDFVIVADLDNLNTLLNQAALESCWKRKDWDMCAANQNGPYYDIWALRHKDWCAEDCWAQYKFLSTYSLDLQQNLNTSVYSKMLKIPIDAEWIAVDSAFGGFAVYKKSAFDHCEYSGINDAGEEFCEHTHFHRILKNNGAKLFINPQLINAGWTEHAMPLLLKNRIKRRIKSLAKEFLVKAIGMDRTTRLERGLTGIKN